MRTQRRLNPLRTAVTLLGNMTTASSVIYLPPGVVPPAHGLPPGPMAVPFDRQFFELVLPRAVQAFCSQVECHIPRVEVYTTDGSTLFVNGISGVTDAWVAVQASREDHENAIQVFLPYQTIYRVEIHSESDAARRRLGYVEMEPGKSVPAVQAIETPAPAPAQAAKPRRKGK